MKTLKHILSIFVWTVIALHLVLFVLLKFPFIQEFVGSEIASVLNSKLGTKVTIGKVYVGLFNRVVVDDILILDQSNKDMLKAKRVSVKISLPDLVKGEISISSAQLVGSHLSLYQATPTAKPNYQFVIDSLTSKDKTQKETPLDLNIGSLIIHRASIDYDKLFEPHTYGHFNPAHIHIKEIGANVVLNKLTKDTINLTVKKLTARELSGINLKKLSFRLSMGRNAAQLNDFKLEMPNSTIKLRETNVSYTIDNNRLLTPTLTFSTSIKNSIITPSDFEAFYDELSALDQQIHLQTDIRGKGERIIVDRIAANTPSQDIDISAAGWIAKRGKNSEWAINIKKAEVKNDAVNNICHILAKKEAMPIATIKMLGDISLKGKANCTPNHEMHADCELGTDIGSVAANASIDAHKHFSVKANGQNIELGKLLSTSQLGEISAKVEAKGTIPGNGASLIAEAKCVITRLVAKGHVYENIHGNGKYSENEIMGTIAIDDPSLRLAMEGKYKKKAAINDISITGSIRDFNPNALNLTNKWNHKKINLDLVANFNGNYGKISSTKGTANIDINDITIVSQDTTFGVGNVIAEYDNISSTPRMNIASDFANIKIEGNFDFKTLAASYTNILSKVIPGMPGLPKHNDNANNEFLLIAKISDTEIFNQLLELNLSLNKPINLTTMIEDRNAKAYLYLDAADISYNGKRYEGISLDISQPDAESVACNVALTKEMDNGDKVSAIITGIANDNKLKTSLSIANDDQTFSGVINSATSFFINDNNQQTAKLELESSQLSINGQAWNILPAVITYSKDNLEIEGFSISNGWQFLAINGKSTTSATDSLSVQLQGIDVAYVLNLVNFHSVDFGGKAYGRLHVKGLFSSTPQINGKLNVSDFTFQNGGLGTLKLDAVWNNAKGQIDIDAVADDGPKSKTLINGYISPMHNSIDLNFGAQHTNLDFLMSFTHAFLSKLKGTASGKMRLVGKFSALDLLGKVAVEGNASVKVLGCDYSLRGDSVEFVHNDILFHNTRIYDRDGNVGYVNGGLHHDNLRRMTYDLDINASNLLSYDFVDFYGESFYATVYASGNVKIHGVPGLLKIDVNATPQRGSSLVYNVSNPDAIANQKFIAWNNISSKDTTQNAKTTAVIANYDLPSDTHINFIINCNQNVAVKLLMDSKTNDYITLYGDGVINADYYNNGAFKMTGTYRVDHGTYGITIQNIIKKNFIFNQGGTIIFGGNPFDAALNLEAAYTVNGVSLSDLNIGSSFKSNTIKVNCLMNIGGIAQTPVVTFDLDFPTLGTDEKQMVKSVINGEEEMNQQVLYLLGIGRFYPQGNNNSMTQGDNQPDQTSLAMQSLLSGTISSQINQLLNTVINNNNWNFGANISTGDEGWNNAEYEGLLSGQLLNNRLLINGQFGYRDSKNTATTSFIGDFDIKYLLTPNGNLALKVYNQTNDRYFTKSSLNTQGVGLIMKKDFNNIGELLRSNKKKKVKK